MLTLSYCSLCHGHLNDYGEMVCETFEKICSHVAFSGSYMKFLIQNENEDAFQPEPSFSMIVKFLERKGYIVTTEIEKGMLKIKPNGMHYEELEDSRMFFFCLCDCIE